MKNCILFIHLLNNGIKYGSIFFSNNWQRFFEPHIFDRKSVTIETGKCLSAMEIALALSWLVARQITGRKRPCMDYDSRDAARERICMCLWMPDASSLVNVTSVPVTNRERLRGGEKEEGKRIVPRYSNLGGESCIVPRWHAAFPIAARKICAFVRICEKIREINVRDRIYPRSDAFEYRVEPQFIARHPYKNTRLRICPSSFTTATI